MDSATESGTVHISPITLGELPHGIAISSRPAAAQARIDALLSVVKSENPPMEAASHSAAIRADLERAGTPIGPNDLWIAAHARSANYVLIANNQREFKRVDDLVIENRV